METERGTIEKVATKIDALVKVIGGRCSFCEEKFPVPYERNGGKCINYTWHIHFQGGGVDVWEFVLRGGHPSEEVWHFGYHSDLVTFLLEVIARLASGEWKKEKV